MPVITAEKQRSILGMIFSIRIMRLLQWFACNYLINFVSSNNKIILTRVIYFRRQAAEDALEHLKNWLNGCGQIALFDATNTTRQRRQMVYDHCQRNNFKPIFIESICDDHNVIESSVKVSFELWCINQLLSGAYHASLLCRQWRLMVLTTLAWIKTSLFEISWKG